MPSFTINEVLGQEQFSTANGDFIAYRVKFSGDQGNGEAQHKRKASSPAPNAGETIDAELVHKNGKVELKRIYQPGGQSNGGGKSSYDDPKTIARITRSHAQKVAVEYLKIAHNRGTLPEDFKLGDIGPIIDFFENDVRMAAERA